MDHVEPARQLASSSLGWFPSDSHPNSRRSRTPGEAAPRRSAVIPGEPRPGDIRERWRIIVRGRVQGVGFRAACCARALSLGLGGWVRNCTDGSVEVQVEGACHQLAELELWCARGPSPAEVRGVNTLQMALTGEDWFEVRR